MKQFLPWCAWSALSITALAQSPDAAAPTLDPTVIYGELSQYQNWPLSASTLGGNEVSLIERKEIRDLAQIIPNLSHTDTGVRAFGDVISLRGLTNTPFFSSPSVVQYIDDVPMSTTSAYVNEMFAVDRADVLRGSQGGLFGRNGYGGVINIKTKQPTNDWSGSLGAGYGSYDLIEGDGYIMGPLVKDKLFLKLGGGYAERDGYLKNTTLRNRPDEQEHQSALGALIWKPNDRWDVTLSGSWDQFRDGAHRLTPLAGNPFHTNANLKGQSDQDSNSQALRVKYQGRDVDFLSVTSRRRWQLDPYFFDLDFSPAPAADALLTSEQTYYTQEFRWSSKENSNSPWDWTAGAFFSTLDSGGDSVRHFVVPTPDGNFLPVTTTTNWNLTDDTFAVFGQLSYKGLGRWGLHAGLRAEYSEKSMDRNASGLFGPVAPMDLEEDYFDVSPKLSVDYALTNKSLFYVSTALAAKPGGFSAFVDNPSLAEFDTEHAWTTELGYKISALDDRLRVNTALFYSYVEDYQVERSLIGTDYVVLNADKAQIFGAELEFQAQVFEGFTIDGSVGYTHAELRDFRDPVSGRDFSGNRAPFVPELDASIAATYRHNSGVFGRVELIYQGETYFDDANRGDFRERGYTLLNAAVGYEKNGVQISLYGQNITDELYYQNMSPDLRAGTVGAPARFGVRCRYMF